MEVKGHPGRERRPEAGEGASIYVGLDDDLFLVFPHQDDSGAAGGFTELGWGLPGGLLGQDRQQTLTGGPWTPTIVLSFGDCSGDTHTHAL